MSKLIEQELNLHILNLNTAFRDRKQKTAQDAILNINRLMRDLPEAKANNALQNSLMSPGPGKPQGGILTQLPDWMQNIVKDKGLPIPYISKALKEQKLVLAPNSDFNGLELKGIF